MAKDIHTRGKGQKREINAVFRFWFGICYLEGSACMEDPLTMITQSKGLFIDSGIATESLLWNHHIPR